MLIYIQELDGEIISNSDSTELFGDDNNMSYKHFRSTNTYADDVRMLNNLEPKNTTYLTSAEKTKIEEN